MISSDNREDVYKAGQIDRVSPLSVTAPETAAVKPPLPLAGGCQCGACRYEIRAWPLTFYLCHCTECQAQSGSAFSESLQVGAANLAITGPTGTFVRRTDTGTTMEGTFCTACGTRLVHRRGASPDVANVRAGTLDDRSWLSPVAHIWTRSRQPWFDVGDVPAFETAGDVEQMRELWRRMWDG